ncbi:MAG: hypothetical protein ABII09_09515 [Planctomycetota bacterium]
MDKHITFVGAIYIGLGVIKILAAGFIFVLFAGIAILTGDETPAAILLFIGFFVALLLTTWSLPAIIGGFGLLKRKNWARILIIILAVPELFCIPIGTAIGIYSLWVLVNDETAKLFSPITAHPPIT